MKKLPVLIERTKTHIRAVAFKASVMGSNFEQVRSYEFGSLDFAEQNEELNIFIREHFFDNAGIYINLPIEELILREFSLPFIARGKIKDLLPFELESQLPYEISDIFYDYHAYPDEQAGKTRIIAAACRKSFLESYAQFFLKNEHLLKGVYVQTDGLLQLCTFLEEPYECILYMSGNFSIYLIANQGNWEFARVVPIGYDQLFSDISKKWKKDAGESKKILTEIPVSDSDIVDFEYYQQKFKLTKAKSKDLVESITKFSSSVTHELKSTLIRHYQDKDQINNFVLMSDLDNQVFLENILADKTPLNISPFPYGRTPVSLIGRPYIIPVGMSYAISGMKYLNLMGSDLKRLFKKKKNHTDRLGIVILGVALILFIASFAINVVQKQKHYKVIQNKKKELFVKLFNKNPDDKMSLTVQAAQLVEEQKKRSEIYKLQSNKLKLGKILYELNNALVKASGLQVERISYSNNSVQLLGSAEDFNEVNNIKNLVLGNPVFSEADMKDQRSYQAPGGQNRVRFNMTVKPRVQED